MSIALCSVGYTIYNIIQSIRYRYIKTTTTENYKNVNCDIPIITLYNIHNNIIYILIFQWTQIFHEENESLQKQNIIHFINGMF